MSEQVSWQGSSTSHRGFDLKVKVMAAALTAAAPVTVAAHTLQSPAPAVSSPLLPGAGATSPQPIHSSTMAAASPRRSGPVSLSAGTWIGVAAIAIPTLATLIIGVWGVFDVRAGLKDLESEVKSGFEKIDDGLVLVRERVSRLEGAQAKAAAPQPVVAR